MSFRQMKWTKDPEQVRSAAMVPCVLGLCTPGAGHCSDTNPACAYCFARQHLAERQVAA